LLSIALPPQRYPALTLSPQQQRQQGMQLLLSWLLAQAQAQAQPLLLMIEDLHWADPSTLEFIELLIPGVATIPVMVVLTSRPEFAPGRKQQAPVTPLLLNRLNQTQIEQMLWRITHGKMLPAEIIEQIRRKTDGVPLFIEELTRMLLESGQLRETGQGFELATPFDQLSVPLTLEDSLRARLDQLDSGKLIAQWGSVIGREFSHQLLTALVPQEASVLQSGIRELLLAGLLYQQGLSPNTKYYFKHALIRDAAYQSMLKRQRQNIHREVAKTLKTQFPVVVAEHPELIAQHYTQAGLIKAAIPYWTQAGQKAARRWAHKEAIGHLTTALQLLKAVPDHPRREHQELTIRISLGPSLSAIHGPAHETVEQCFERARQLCREQGETAHLFPVITHLWRLHHSSARYRDARQLGEEMLIEARRQNDSQHLQLAYQAIGTSNYFLGELISGCNDLQKSLELADQLEQAGVDSRYSEDPRVQCLAFLLGPLQYLGYPDQALQKSRQLLALAEQLRHPHSLAMALHFIGLFLLNRDDLTAAQQNNDALITLAGDHKFAHFLALGELMRGLIMIRQDQGEAGIARLRQGIIDFESTGSLTGLTAWRLRLAEAYSITGQPQRGLLAFNEAMKLMEQTGERFVESALYLQQGLLLLQLKRPDPVKAEACLLQALNVARRQQAKWWELRAAISLARLWRDQGKAQQACQLLAPVYEWFTEGFDTVYLKQAKGLLAQLQN
jgi:predicted ATPase